MKKMRYLLIGLLTIIISTNGVSALDNPTFNTSVVVEKGAGSTITITATARNTGSCEVGLKQGEFWIYLDDAQNIVAKATNLEGGSTISATFKHNNTPVSKLCVYDGTTRILKCAFGTTSTAPVMTDYSTCNDEISVSFKTDLCEGSTDCNIKTEVVGIPVVSATGDNVDGTTSITKKTLETDDFKCSDTWGENPGEENPGDNENPNNTDDPETPENPDTIDETSLYILFSVISFMLISGCFLAFKRKKIVR